VTISTVTHLMTVSNGTKRNYETLKHWNVT